MEESICLTTSEAAGLLRLNPGTLEAWRSRGFGPRFVKLGKAVRYLRADLEQFAEATARTTTREVAV
jgi:hypothetical protein